LSRPSRIGRSHRQDIGEQRLIKVRAHGGRRAAGKEPPPRLSQWECAPPRPQREVPVVALGSIEHVRNAQLGRRIGRKSVTHAEVIASTSPKAP